MLPNGGLSVDKSEFEQHIIPAHLPVWMFVLALNHGVTVVNIQCRAHQGAAGRRALG